NREVESLLRWRQNVGPQPYFPIEPFAVGHGSGPAHPNPDTLLKPGLRPFLARRQERPVRLCGTKAVVRATGMTLTQAPQPAGFRAALSQREGVYRKRSQDGSMPATSKTTRE